MTCLLSSCSANVNWDFEDLPNCSNLNRARSVVKYIYIHGTFGLSLSYVELSFCYYFICRLFMSTTECRYLLYLRYRSRVRYTHSHTRTHVRLLLDKFSWKMAGILNVCFLSTYGAVGNAWAMGRRQEQSAIAAHAHLLRCRSHSRKKNTNQNEKI